MTVAQKRLDRVLTPGTPTDISAAQAEVKKAESDLAVLQKPPATPLPEDITAAQRAVTVAQARSRRRAGGEIPLDPAAVSTAQLELDKALAALAALKPPLAAGDRLRTGRGRRRAHEARGAAGPAGDPADVAAARQDLAGRAGRGANAASRAERTGSRRRPAARWPRLARSSAQVQGPAAAVAARSAVSKAVADLAALQARSGPASASDIALARLKYSAAAARLLPRASICAS